MFHLTALASVAQCYLDSLFIWCYDTAIFCFYHSLCTYQVEFYKEECTLINSLVVLKYSLYRKDRKIFINSLHQFSELVTQQTPKMMNELVNIRNSSLFIYLVCFNPLQVLFFLIFRLSHFRQVEAFMIFFCFLYFYLFWIILVKMLTMSI